MYVNQPSSGPLASWIRDELNLTRDVVSGDRSKDARRAQEWLTYHGYGLVIDGAYGPISADTTAQFQTDNGLNSTGIVDDATFNKLTQPLQRVLEPLPAGSVATFSDAVAAFAQRHLAVHPREFGGDNRGPFVRAYMKGLDGEAWAWCSGFASFLMHQAAEQLGIRAPFKGSFSCDIMMCQSDGQNLFVKENNVILNELVPGSLFLVRRTSTDWTHIGVVMNATASSFSTIEGNTNDDGVSNGFEVCARTRSYSGRDFIVFE